MTIKPTPKQHEVYKAIESKKEILFGGAAGGGKSFVMCEIILLNCLRFPGIRVGLCRKELKDLRSSTYITWREVCKHHSIPEDSWKYNAMDNFIEFANGSRIDLMALRPVPQDPMCDFLGSYEFTFCCIDEASEIEEEAYNKLMTRIGRCKNKEYGINGFLLCTANPTKNFLYHYYFVPWINKELPKHRTFIQALPTDNPHLDPDYIENLKRQPKVNRERLLEGNWQYDSSPDALINYEAIEALWLNEHIQEGEPVITADIALQGVDKLVVMIWKGWVLYEIKTMDRSNGEEVIRLIQTMADKYEVRKKHIIFDSVGVGDTLQGMIKYATPFKSNSAARKGSNYKTLKDQCAYGLARRIEKGGIYIRTEKHKQEIIQELEQLQAYRVDEEGAMQVIPKKLIKKNIGRSPDFLDCLIMREYHTSVPKNTKVKFIEV